MTTSASPPLQTDRVDLWFAQRGAGPDVLLLAGLGDPLEAWQLQLDGLADRYRLTAFDSRGVDRARGGERERVRDDDDQGRGDPEPVAGDDGGGGARPRATSTAA